MPAAELELFPTVFRETLWGEKFLARLEELRIAGARIETMSWAPKMGNAVWEIAWRLNPNRADA